VLVLVRDKRSREIVKLLTGKRGEKARFRPESIHRVWSAFDFGQKETASGWLTLLAHRIAKRVGRRLPAGSNW
jgi:hypothetical protein